MIGSNKTCRIGIHCSPFEHAMWEQVTSLLNRGFQGTCTFQTAWLDDLDSVADHHCDVICLSMLPDLWQPRSDWSSIEARWRRAAEVLRDRVLVSGASVFVITIFRYTAAQDHAVLPSLRRLNLLAARLSQEFGLFVIDVDRKLAHLGAVNLGADARLASMPARQMVADMIVETLLNVGMDHLAEPAAIQAAVSWHEVQRSNGSAGPATPTYVGQLRRSHVKGRHQAFATGAHDVYGGIRSILRDLCAPRLGLSWRMPLLSTLLRMVSGRISARIVRDRS